LKIELLRRGAITLQITLQPDSGRAEPLVFELDLDPSQVAACVIQVDVVLARFPPAVTTTYAPSRPSRSVDRRERPRARAGTLAQFAAPRLREWEHLWWRSQRECDSLRSRIGELLRELSRVSDSG